MRDDELGRARIAPADLERRGGRQSAHHSAGLVCINLDEDEAGAHEEDDAAVSILPARTLQGHGALARPAQQAPAQVEWPVQPQPLQWQPLPVPQAQLQQSAPEQAQAQAQAQLPPGHLPATLAGRGLCQEVLALKQTLDGDAPEGEVLQALQRLEDLGPLSQEALKDTLVGRSVNALLKRTESAPIRLRSRVLLGVWRSVVLRQQQARSKVDEVPPGVDPEVWPHIPLDSRAWAVGRTPAPCRRASDSEADKENGGAANGPRSAGPGAALASRDEEKGPSSRRVGRPCKRPRPPEEKQRDAAAAGACGDGEPLHCVICLTQRKSHAFVPCGHQCACRDCATTVCQRRDAKCPICRARVQMVVQIFR